MKIEIPPEVRAANRRVFGREESVVEVFKDMPSPGDGCRGGFGTERATLERCTDPPTTSITTSRKNFFDQPFFVHTVVCDRHAAVMRMVEDAGDSQDNVVTARSL